MFLLVSGRHVGAHLGGHQHGVSIQISVNLEKTFLRISSIRKIAVTWILARVFAYLPSFYFQILDLIYWTILIFYFDLFWMAWHWKPPILWSTLSQRRVCCNQMKMFSIPLTNAGFCQPYMIRLVLLLLQNRHQLNPPDTLGLLLGSSLVLFLLGIWIVFRVASPFLGLGSPSRPWTVFRKVRPREILSTCMVCPRLFRIERQTSGKNTRAARDTEDTRSEERYRVTP